jgi:hypothetical protein
VSFSRDYQIPPQAPTLDHGECYGDDEAPTLAELEREIEVTRQLYRSACRRAGRFETALTRIAAGKRTREECAALAMAALNPTVEHPEGTP